MKYGISILGMVFLCCSAFGQNLQAGAASVDITPPTGFPMWGYASRHDAPSDGVLFPLKARALVLEAGERKMALVGLDLGRAPTRASTAAIRAKVQAAGIDPVFLVASHTHHGPVLELDTWPSKEKPYVRDLEQKLADVILAADKARKPARLGVTGKEVPFNRNRHSRRAEKPADREMLVLRVEGEDGKPIAHAVNFAAHPTTIDRKVNKFSPDYPGYLAELVEKETGVPCLFLQGAAGDLSVQNPAGVGGPEAIGQAIGREVLDMIASMRCGSLERGTLQVEEDDWRFRSRYDLGNPLLKGLFVTAFFQELVDFYEREYREGIRPSSVTALLDGRIAFVGTSGEFFCGHSLSLKRRSRLEHVFFLGYCNDYHQYFPTIEGAAEGGYGADPLVSPVEVGAGERIIDRALIHLYRMRGRLPNLQ